MKSTTALTSARTGVAGGFDVRHDRTPIVAPSESPDSRGLLSGSATAFSKQWQLDGAIVNGHSMSVSGESHSTQNSKMEPLGKSTCFLGRPANTDDDG